MKKHQISLFLLIFIFLTACSMEVSKVGDAPAPTVGVITATLYPTFTPRATATPLPATVLPTVEPVLGKVTAQINLREHPRASSRSLGMLGINSEVEIIGQNAQEDWYQINADLPNGERVTGWGSADFISTESKPNVPVVSGGDTSSGVEETNGQVTQQINVRSGPGVEFGALGILNIGDRVFLLAKNITGTWIEIEYEGGEEGKGWVFAAYVESDVVEDLPIAEGAVAIATEIAATAAPVYTPAPEDGDSMEEPAIDITFSASDSRSFSYSSDLSSPEGDAEDWVAFHPDSTEDRVDLLIDLDCEGNGSIYVELWQGGIKLTEWEPVSCGDSDYPLNMYKNVTYEFRLMAKRASKLAYVNYILQVRAAP
ncbi:MAG: SH3 domain-containing protein [Anaerolineae bacterium]|jgi:hypothetical protein|nr:SH3 domain-containing protein [Anaerolineae bacterium]MBT7073350.1 SH3 domain-containing protein [Anaerolineae bacterium]MBT7782352.1 SH3 domain-containing protein [Anaerolineae bacterium]